MMNGTIRTKLLRGYKHIRCCCCCCWYQGKISTSIQQQQPQLLQQQHLFSTTTTTQTTKPTPPNRMRDSIGISTRVILQQVKDGILPIEKAVVQISHLNTTTTTAAMTGIDNTSITGIDNTSSNSSSCNKNHPSSSLPSSSLSVPKIASFANIDHDRYERTKFPEVIFAQGKTSQQVACILEEMAGRQALRIRQQQQVLELQRETNNNNNNTTTPTIVEQKYIPPILATRVIPEMYNEINETYTLQNGRIEYHPIARIISMQVNNTVSRENSTTVESNNIDNDNNTSNIHRRKERVVVATAGTTDIAIAEEAAVTLEASDIVVERIYDVGVAGLHRVINAIPQLTHPDVKCIIVCAGMDGALPSVVGGLVSVPVIAVPTSIGYGAAFHGVSALLTMLNSCAPGVGVVNIDNGFGAAALAYKIIKR